MLTVGPLLVSAAVHSRRRLVPVFLSALLCPSALPDRLVRSTKRRFPHVPCHLSCHRPPRAKPDKTARAHTPYFLCPTQHTSPRLDLTRLDSSPNARLLFSCCSIISQSSSISSARFVPWSIPCPSPLLSALPWAFQASLQGRPGFPFLAAQVSANLTLTLRGICPGSA